MGVTWSTRAVRPPEQKTASSEEGETDGLVKTLEVENRPIEVENGPIEVAHGNSRNI